MEKFSAAYDFATNLIAAIAAYATAGEIPVGLFDHSFDGSGVVLSAAEVTEGQPSPLNGEGGMTNDEYQEAHEKYNGSNNTEGTQVQGQIDTNVSSTKGVSVQGTVTVTQQF